MTLGTKWTAPGEGDTVKDLVALTESAGFMVAVPLNGYEAKHNTSLASTGYPPSSYDVSRVIVALRREGIRVGLNGEMLVRNI